MDSPVILRGVLLSGTHRWIRVLIFFLSFLTVLSGALSIPFFYETQTLWYKFGVDRTLLQIGQLLGLLTAVLLFFQPILASRPSFLERTMGLDKLLRLHHINGFAILILALGHILLILVPEGLSNLPMGMKFWPEIVGAVVLVLLIPMVLLAQLHRPLKIPYGLWSRLHRSTGPLIFLLLGVHILFVSDSFDNAVPRNSLFLVMGSILLLLAFTKVRQIFIQKSSWTITEVTPLNGTTTSLHLTAQNSTKFCYSAGQFAFLSFPSLPWGTRSSEPHPFTIASSPHQNTLQFIIKNCGDWTAELASLQPKTPAYVEGPYGRFSYTIFHSWKSIVMIAGGIGITPMLSMLREMAAVNCTKRIILIWSCRNRGELVCREELAQLQNDLPNFSCHFILTSEKGRINQSFLHQVLPSEKAPILLCGPPHMMISVKKLLLQRGFSRSDIHWEIFSL